MPRPPPPRGGGQRSAAQVTRLTWVKRRSLPGYRIGPNATLPWSNGSPCSFAMPCLNCAVGHASLSVQRELGIQPAGRGVTTTSPYIPSPPCGMQVYLNVPALVKVCVYVDP